MNNDKGKEEQENLHSIVKPNRFVSIHNHDGFS